MHGTNMKIHSTVGNAGFNVAVGVGLSVVRCSSTAERVGKGNLSFSEKSY
jgi:hypothetical protein